MMQLLPKLFAIWSRLSTALLLAALSSSAAAQSLTYPSASPQQLAERRFGLTFSDPYRWMENRDDPKLFSWIRAELAVTNSYTEGSTRDEIRDEMLAIYSTMKGKSRTEAFKTIQREDTRYYDPFNNSAENADGQGLVSSAMTSPTGRYALTLTADSGSDFQQLTIKDTQTGQFLSDLLHVKFSSVLWDEDEASFIYVSDRDARMGDQYVAIRRHRLGTKQVADQLLLEGDTPDVTFSIFQTDAGYFIQKRREDGSGSIGSFNPTTGTVSYFYSWQNAEIRVFDFRGSSLYCISNLNADHLKITAIDTKNGAEQDILAEGAETLSSIVMLGDDIFYTAIRDAEERLYRFNMATKVTTPIVIPAASSAVLSVVGEDLQVQIKSYGTLPSNWKFDRATQTLIQDGAPEETPFPITVTKLYYTAHNGMQIPVWYAHRADIKPDANSPVYLYGYGGFVSNMLPSLRREYLPWFRRGGVVATVVLPGGREYGEAWHRAGMLLNKHNVYSDFAAAARMLINTGRASTEKLAIGGVSNGGLLVGATVNKYPDLFRAAVPEVGVMDMLIYQVMTGGKWWISEYGDRDNQTHFRNLISYSPYHNLATRRYPHTLVMTADQDDRVNPSHSYKYLARLQEKQSRDRVALLYVKRVGSHSSASGTPEAAAEYTAARWAFLLKALDVK